MLSRSLRSLVIAIATVCLLGGCVAGAIFPLPAGSSSSEPSDKSR